MTIHSSLADLTSETDGALSDNQTRQNSEENSKTQSGKLWGGRFSSGPSEELEALSKSTQFDWRLAKFDILGSIAHAGALARAEIVPAEDAAKIIVALEEMLDELKRGTLKPNESDEDVHGALERILIEKTGAEVGGKLRAGRSRNDQIATLIRMFLKEECHLIANELLKLVEILFLQAENAMTSNNGMPAIMPGRTHMQHAQPVLLSHHLLAHAWAFMRDLDRLLDWLSRVDYSPYGSGALAGSTLGLSQEFVAEKLGFSGIEPNSIDATSSRDLIAEFQFCLTLISVNLSRIAEEIIIWNSKEFDYISLDDSFSTGSSIMPQKKNPDIAELARGKVGRILGALTGILVTLKAQPLAYNRDLQEDKEGVFDSIDQLKLILPAFCGMMKTLKFNVKRLEFLAPRGFALATDIAEFLVKKGVPFRIAHEVSGEATKLADSKNCELWQLSCAEYASIFSKSEIKIENAEIEKMVSNLNAEGSVAMRDNVSGTAPASVSKQLEHLKSEIENLKATFNAN